ncbi:uncharacterized protein LOC124312473 isoform X2 [Daphnia pulicaria]|uniref:uncharacterized protein LOC124312472 isoform X2 n=1 Tax=Daphnia pulicaria TaxID=35523 RepID=UPI001EEB0420|nr:uncharacterized protein LOC124312472 isoform X2 [Daphnia pulicaria]XP_046632956.1 uncharacterized protein LOC124312473 isoform X2 [Daphnia pulicaria]
MSTTRPTSDSQPNLNMSITSSATTTTTTKDGETTAHSSSENIQSVARNSTRVPSFLFRQHRSSSNSSPRNILDRLIPSRSETNMQLAQHLFSTTSHRPVGDDSEQHSRQVTPILTFGNKVVRVKPMASLSCGTTPKSKFEFPTLPHRVMYAREPGIHFSKTKNKKLPHDGN